MKIFLPQKVTEILNIYEANGKEAYLVGGFVRDSLLGLPLTDFDITTSATPEETKEIFKNHRIIDTGLKFGTVTLFYKDEKFEITTFRKEENYNDGRHPSQISYAKSLREDLERRDFTVNAMAASKSGEITDLFNGISDIENKKIRAVGDAEIRFAEDKLRILRAVRFSLTLSFEIEEKTLASARRFLPEINEVSKERSGAEIAKMLPFLNEENGIFYKDFFTALFPLATIEKENFKAVSLVNSNLEFMLAALFILTEKELIFKTICDYAFSKKTAENAAFLADFCKKELENEEKSINFVIDYGKEKYLKLASFKRALGYDFYEISELFSRRPFSLKELSINGNDLLNLGIKPEKIGEILNGLLAKAAHGIIENSPEKLLESISI